MILILVSTIKTRKTNNMTELLQVLVQVILLIFLQKKKSQIFRFQVMSK